jgi:hypothetical protein
MTSTARYAVTYLGNGIIRLPRAGIFQTGTRAVVDETIARIAVAHGSFAVEPLTAGAPALGPTPAVPPQMAAAPAPPVDDGKGRRKTRQSAAVRVPRSEASSPAETSAADAHNR